MVFPSPIFFSCYIFIVKSKSIHSGSSYWLIMFFFHYVLVVVNLVSQYNILYCLILQRAIEWFDMSTFNTEENLLKLRLHKEFLTHYRNQNTVPKGFRWKFNLALRAKNKDPEATIQKQLTATSFKIMGKVMTAVNKEIHSLTKQMKTIKTVFVSTSTKEYYNMSLATIRNKVNTLERSIRKKQRKKFIRDSIIYGNNSNKITKKNIRLSK